MRAGENTPRVIFLGATIEQGEMQCEHFVIDDETQAGSLPLVFVDDNYEHHDVIITWAEVLSSRESVGLWAGNSFPIESGGENSE